MIGAGRRECLLGLSGVALTLSAPAHANSKGSQSMVALNKEVVLDFIQVVWRQGELGALPRFWTMPTASITPRRPIIRRASTLCGPTMRAFAAAFVGFTNVEIAVLQQIAEDDRVTTQLRTSAHHTVSGKTVTLDTIRIDRLEKAKIAEHWSVADMAGFMRQLSA